MAAISVLFSSGHLFSSGQKNTSIVYFVWWMDGWRKYKLLWNYREYYFLTGKRLFSKEIFIRFIISYSHIIIESTQTHTHSNPCGASSNYKQKQNPRHFPCTFEIQILNNIIQLLLRKNTFHQYVWIRYKSTTRLCVLRWIKETAFWASRLSPTVLCCDAHPWSSPMENTFSKGSTYNLVILIDNFGNYKLPTIYI